MSTTATLAPSSARRRHTAFPMPDPPPVTTAVLFLSPNHDSLIGVNFCACFAQPVCENFHHREREKRSLLHHVLKPAPIDRHQPAGGLRNHRCAARLVIDERQLTDNGARAS